MPCKEEGENDEAGTSVHTGSAPGLHSANACAAAYGPAHQSSLLCAQRPLNRAGLHSSVETNERTGTERATALSQLAHGLGCCEHGLPLLSILSQKLLHSFDVAEFRHLSLSHILRLSQCVRHAAPFQGPAGGRSSSSAVRTGVSVVQSKTRGAAVDVEQVAVRALHGAKGVCYFDLDHSASAMAPEDCSSNM